MSKTAIDFNFLKSTYDSHTSRISDFRAEQDRLMTILTGLFTLSVGGVINLKTQNQLQGFVTPLFVFVTLVSATLFGLFLRHASVIINLISSLSYIEEQMGFSYEAAFYAKGSKLRFISYLSSLLLPLILYIAVAVFFIFVTDVKVAIYLSGLAMHFLIVSLAFPFFYRRLARTNRILPPEDIKN